MDPITGYQPNSPDLNLPAQTGQNLKTSQLTNVNITKQKSTDITLFTTEGDKVTISSNSQINAGYTTYNSIGLMDGQTTEVQTQSFYFDKQYEFEMSVEGDLNKQELKDIRKAFRTIEKLTRDFLSGRMNRVLSRVAKIMNLGSISSLDVSLQYQRSVSIQQESRVMIGAPVPEPTPQIPPIEEPDTPIVIDPPVSGIPEEGQVVAPPVLPEELAPPATEPVEEVAVVDEPETHAETTPPASEPTEEMVPTQAASLKAEVAHITQMTANIHIGTPPTPPGDDAHPVTEIEQMAVTEEPETPVEVAPPPSEPTEKAAPVPATTVEEKAAPVSKPTEGVVVAEEPETAAVVAVPGSEPMEETEPAETPMVKVEIEKLVQTMTQVVYESNVEPGKMVKYTNKFLDRLYVKFVREQNMDQSNLKLARSINKNFMKTMKRAFNMEENNQSSRIAEQHEKEQKTQQGQDGSQGIHNNAGQRRHNYSRRHEF